MNVLVAALAAGLLIAPAPAERSERTIEREKLESGKYRQRIAAALFDGLKKFVKRNAR